MASHIYDQESGEPRWYGVYSGLVTTNADPEKRGRVQAVIPGLCEPHTNWALPAGGSHSSGEPGHGSFDPPAKGAAVFIMFLCGDIDEPVYFGGWRALTGGHSDAPTEVQNASVADAANKLKIFETAQFAIVIDERAASSAISLRSKVNDVRVEVRGDKIKLGKNAAEKIVKGSTWWQQVDLELTRLLAALQADAGACQGPLSSRQPVIQMQITAIQAFKQAGAGEAFLSELSLTE
jgi:hypothetical protein